MEHEVILTVKQVAVWLQVSPGFVKAHAEELGAIRVGGSARKAGHLRLRESKVQEWISAGGTSAMRRPNEKAARTKSERMAG